MSHSSAIAYEREVPDVLTALSEVHSIMDRHGFERSITHLVQLRASQINQCAYCVKMHTAEARRDGETSDRLDRVIVWRHVDDFSAREKLALAWTEALTTLKPGTDIAALRVQLQEHFDAREISVLTVAVAMINLWNRIQVSRH